MNLQVYLNLPSFSSAAGGLGREMPARAQDLLFSVSDTSAGGRTYKGLKVSGAVGFLGLGDWGGGVYGGSG